MDYFNKLAEFSLKDFIPEGLRSQIVEALDDNVHPFHAEITFSDENGVPQTKSVVIRYISGRGTHGFFAHVNSPEWKALGNGRSLKGYFQDTQRQIEWHWEGTVELLQGEANAYILDRRWLELREDLRRHYWLEYQSGTKESQKPVDPNVRCPTVGIILCHPHHWEISHTNEDGTTARHRFIRRGDDWILVS